jgi:hypothetical protein
MFKELKDVKSRPCTEDNCYCGAQSFIIIDDDFDQQITCQDDFATLGFLIMKVYEDRNLNVVKNFILYLKAAAGDASHWNSLGIDSFKLLIEINEKENVLFKKYKKELEKYLLLL